MRLPERSGASHRRLPIWGGTLPCPCCSAPVTHTHRENDVLSCDCGWELTWGEYFRTIQHKQLSGAEEVLSQFRAYAERFPRARDPREKMVLIDQLIHGFHSYSKGVGSAKRPVGTPTRPVAVNLIGGRLGEVLAFLDSLTYGPGSTRGMRDVKAEYDRNAATARGWALRRMSTPLTRFGSRAPAQAPRGHELAWLGRGPNRTGCGRREAANRRRVGQA